MEFWDTNSIILYHLVSHYKVNLEPDSCRRRIPKFEALHWIGFSMHELPTKLSYDATNESWMQLVFLLLVRLLLSLSSPAARGTRSRPSPNRAAGSRSANPDPGRYEHVWFAFGSLGYVWGLPITSKELSIKEVRKLSGVLDYPSSAFDTGPHPPFADVLYGWSLRPWGLLGGVRTE